MHLVNLTNAQSKEDSLNITAHVSWWVGWAWAHRVRCIGCKILLPNWSCKQCGILVRHLHPTWNVSVVHHLPLIVQVILGYNLLSLLNQNFDDISHGLMSRRFTKECAKARGRSYHPPTLHQCWWLCWVFDKFSWTTCTWVSMSKQNLDKENAT